MGQLAHQVKRIFGAPEQLVEWSQASIDRKGRRGFRKGSRRKTFCVPLRIPLRPMRLDFDSYKYSS